MTGREILTRSAAEFGLTLDDVTRHGRIGNRVEARMVAYRLMRDRTTLSLAGIANIAKRDPSCVSSGLRQFDQFYASSIEVRAAYETVLAAIGPETGEFRSRQRRVATFRSGRAA